MLDISCKEAKALCAFIDLYKSRLTPECYKKDLEVVHNKILRFTVLCDIEEKNLMKSAREKIRIFRYCKYCSAELGRGVHGFCGNNCLELYEADTKARKSPKYKVKKTDI